MSNKNVKPSISTYGVEVERKMANNSTDALEYCGSYISIICYAVTGTDEK
jgi:hypothetical protein